MKTRISQLIEALTTMIALNMLLETETLADESLYKAPVGNSTISVTGPVNGDSGWNVNLLRNSEKSVVLWKAVRPPKIYWSPNGLWVAVEDYLMRLSTAVIIFDCSKDTPLLVYQTPFSETEYTLQFLVTSWQMKNGQAQLNLSIRSTEVDQQHFDFVVTPLSRTTNIISTVYPSNSGYGIPP